MSKKKTVESKEMSSIASKLHGQIIRKKLGLFLATDIFLFVALSFIWAFTEEWNHFGKINFSYNRYLTTRGDGFQNLKYVIVDADGSQFEANAFKAFILIISIVSVSVFFHFLNIALAYYGEYKKIKKTLRPINEMALKAEEISKLSFDASKYHTIENAIEHISPDQTKKMKLDDKELEGVEAAMNNMLERMHETYLQQARFVNDASHELRTPIAVIQGYANMLDRWGKEDEEILDESIAAIKNESDHMNHLVEQLLFLARGDAGRTEMKKEDVSLNEVMREIYEESLMIDEKHIYKYNEPNVDIHITADASMIKQAMRILVDNAAKYTKEGDEIVFAVGTMEKNEEGAFSGDGTYIGKVRCPYIQVQDSGIGMAEVDVKHMFERFYRADDTRKVQGTGLGLSIAKWIVDKHDGHFEIVSRKEIGTRIRIVFDEKE